MIDFRPAKLEDTPGLIDLAVESVSRDPLPVRTSRPAISETLKSVIGNSTHFCWVGVEGSAIVSAVVASTSYGFWFDRQQSSVLMFYTRKPGAGMPLIRRYAKWVKERPAIKIAAFELEPAMDSRYERVLARLGFDRRSTNMVYVRSVK